MPEAPKKHSSLELYRNYRDFVSEPNQGEITAFMSQTPPTEVTQLSQEEQDAIEEFEWAQIIAQVLGDENTVSDAGVTSKELSLVLVAETQKIIGEVRVALQAQQAVDNFNKINPPMEYRMLLEQQDVLLAYQDLFTSFARILQPLSVDEVTDDYGDILESLMDSASDYVESHVDPLLTTIKV